MRFPLQISIAVLFTLLIIALGVTLIFFNYNENEKVALFAAEDTYSRITRETTTNIQSLYKPTEVLVDLVARLPSAEADSFIRRTELTHFFAKALKDFSSLSSLYIGYEDGDFFQLRALHDHADVQQALQSPSGSYYALVTIDQQGVERQRTVYFYDENLNVIEESDESADDYDPRTRVWYQTAIASDKQINSGLYLFHLPRVPGATIARRTPNSKAVVGADITIHDLSRSVSALHITPSTRILIFNKTGDIVIRSDQQSPETDVTTDGKIRLPNLSDVTDPALIKLSEHFAQKKQESQFRFTADQRTWQGSITRLPLSGEGAVYLSVLVPEDELLKGVRSLRDQSIVISIIALCFAVIVGWWFARRIAEPLRKLAEGAQEIRQLKLDTTIDVHSHITEVDDLANTMGVMKSAVQEFVEISKALSSEPNFFRLLERLLEQARNACHADGGGISLLTDDGHHMQFTVIANPAIDLHIGGTSDTSVPFEPVPLVSAGEKLSEPMSLVQVVQAEKRLHVVNDITTERKFDFTQLKQRYTKDNYRCQSVLTLPLCNRKNEVIGILELVNADYDKATSMSFRPELVSYVQAMSSQAAITLDNQRLLKAQKELLDSFIQLIAGAIDAKSAYTSGHCQRVPELARMLAKVAHHNTRQPFEDFHLDDDEWYELHIASWLHDCGKVTTPEYVVDKATKLEGLYNRIHEIRMRFEVLWRDFQIIQYQALISGEIDQTAVQQGLDDKLQQLRDDYAFIAECNVGGEFLDEDHIARLQELGKQSWQRYFSDRMGLSQEELARKSLTPEAELPANECLLADKEEHRVERDHTRHPFGDNHYGFDMDVPEHAYNFGELNNLSIQRGTLTAEERFKINEHITQTIMLLDKLPFPRELHRVPRWAGSHHEKLDGTGYPRRLKAEDLSIPERIMAIADIFEALTAADRPYKKAKTLNESLRIMSFMSRDNHICPQLFELFLTSGVYKDYAKKFLLPEQIDEVDISQFVSQ